ncbi:MAG: hypothetical protein FJX89_10130 [Bacteroidetes bacterium]|nr:hypothetical protein [Bacteroidota bacterium]
MLKEIVIAIQSYFKAHRFISEHRLWRWIWIPGIIYALLFAISMYLFGRSANAAIEYMTDLLGISNWVQSLESSMIGFLFTFAAIILWMTLMFFYFSLFKYMWLIVGSPIFAYLSERTSAIIEGREYPFNGRQLLRDIARGVRLALRNSLRQGIYTLAILLFSLLPVVGWATPVLSVILEFYFYGFSMLDYSCERRRMDPKASIAYVGRHRGLAIGNGAVFYLLHAIPGLGWIMAPSYAIVAATISMYEVE